MSHLQGRVRVVGSDDEFTPTRRRSDGRFMRRTGHVVGSIINDHGACAEDPLLVVRFDVGDEDAFWETELRAAGGGG